MTRGTGQHRESSQWPVVRGQWSGALCLVAVVLAVAVLLGGCGRGKNSGAATAPAPATRRAVVVVPAAKPTEPLPEKAECVTAECHATYKTAAHIHGPVAAASCQSCHMPDQGGHRYPLLRTGNALCTFCHAVTGTQAHQHKALEPTAAGSTTNAATAPVSKTGGCLACHDPHTSKAKFLLVTDTVETLCAKCHLVPLKKYAHQPFAAGQCTMCHQPHQSDYANLLRNGDGPQHCFSCHADKQRVMTQSLNVHQPATQSCTTCHSPHATDIPEQLKLPVDVMCLNCHTKVKDQITKARHVHGALTAGNCASCHDAHASNQPEELKARTDKVCLTCHEKAIGTADGRTIAAMGPVLASKNLHGPVKAGHCSECHLPHAADQPNLLKQYFPDTFYAKFDVNNYALCFSCHNPEMVLRARTGNLTNFRDGDENLHFVHVNRDDKGRTCITCHDVHGSNLPNHMAASVPFEGSNWSMPINYERMATGGSCTPGCHDKRTYDRSKPVTTAPATVPATNGGPG
jgi:predicted CXXCH cytochrome family protein